MSSNSVIYAIRVERVSYGSLQILRVKIGRTNDIKRTLREYKRSHADVEILDLWKPNKDLNVSKCEDGMHKIAEKYAYQRKREIFTFLQDGYTRFSNAASQLLRPTTIGKKSQSPSTSTQSANDKYIVEFSDGKTISRDGQSEAMVEAASYMINTHNLIQNIEIPWIPGRSKAIINDTPNWDQAYPDYKALDGGYYVDTKLSSDGKQREIKRMATKCGIDINFKGDW